MKRGSADPDRQVSFCRAKRGTPRELMNTLLAMVVVVALAAIIYIILRRMLTGGVS